ncbi:MAG: HK97 family phage prohead protease [Phreatobacter sp.]|uniref:HK97 family phage prohead protease n=1 Tax=Phreatobacter sp. TaxID=1966341 RepID=UPI00403642ED
MTLNSKSPAIHALPIALDLASAQASAGRIEGYASAFGGQPDANGRLIAAGAFANTIADHRAAGSMPAMLWAHDMAHPIGRWLHLAEDAYGLKAVGQLNLRTARGQEAYQHIRAGDALGLSIGWKARDGGVRHDPGRGATVFSDVDLIEISAVTIPANKRAKIQQIASIASQRELEQVLRAHGLPRSAAVMVAARGWPALASEDPSAAARAALAERVRCATEAVKRLSGGGG